MLRSVSPPVRFFAVTLAVGFGLGVPGALASRGYLPAAAAMPLLTGAVFSPGLAALWLSYQQDRWSGLRRMVEALAGWRAPLWVYGVAVALPFAVNATALAFTPVFGGHVPALPGGLAAEQQASWWLLPLLFLIPSAMEELGWRGYALPRLQQRHSAFTASVAIGVVWAVWHLPWGMVAGSHQAAIPRLVHAGDGGDGRGVHVGAQR